MITFTMLTLVLSIMETNSAIWCDHGTAGAIIILMISELTVFGSIYWIVKFVKKSKAKKLQKKADEMKFLAQLIKDELKKD